MFKRIALSFLFILFTTSAHASLISYQGYTLEESTNIVSDGNLEWLQWDVTSNLSIQQALDTYGSDGWSLATNVQMSTLLNTFFNPDVLWDSEENGVQNFILGDREVFEDISVDLEQQFIALFGSTMDFTADFEGNVIDGQAVAALFGDDENGNGVYNFTFVSNDIDAPQFGGIGDEVTIVPDRWVDMSSVPQPLFGVALVRNVPEPNVVLMFVLSVLLFIKKRIRRD